MERELGISYLSALPSKERQNYQKEVLFLSKLNQELSSSLQDRQEQQKIMEGAIVEMEEEKKCLREKVTHHAIINQTLQSTLVWPKIKPRCSIIARTCSVCNICLIIFALELQATLLATLDW